MVVTIGIYTDIRHLMAWHGMIGYKFMINTKLRCKCGGESFCLKC